MSLTSSGLSDLYGFGVGLTTNFQVQYEDSLPNQAQVKANANALLAVVENEFNVTTGWFATPGGKFGTGNRQVVNLNIGAGGGGNNSGYGSAINIDSIGGGSSPTQSVLMVWMNEWVEILMSLTSNWNRGDSSGEGLSQYCGIVRFQQGHYSYYGSWVDNWLNGGQAWSSNNSKFVPSPNSARSDWVTQTFTGVTTGAGDQIHGDGDTVSFGCALAFIYYLNAQLGFSINQIIADYNSNLAAAYNALSGDPGNPFPSFLDLIASVYPASQTANIPGPVSDNPFPIAEVSFLDGKNTFGLDETKDIINTLGGLVPGAFWVQVDGFSKNSFNALGVQVSPFTGSFDTLPGVQISPDPLGPQYESGVNDTTPQRIRIPFDITLSNPIIGQFPGTGSATYSLSGSLNIGGTQVSGSPASTQFELLAGADPYFTNIDPTQGNQAYLSQDLRVFTGVPGQNQFPIPGGPKLDDSVSDAFTYVKNLLTYLNQNFTNPNGPDPFTSIFPDQTGAGQDFSSVAPVTIDLSNIFNPKIYNNYNFAVARVRLRGSSGVAGEAKDVRVFFRLFSTQSIDTDYDINSTYRSTPDNAGKPGSPLLGSGNTTIPFFATGNLSSNTDYVAGGPNIKTLVIPDHQDDLWWYYGCFLNFYDPNNTINGAQVQTLLNGTHHCLVAQIAYDDAPIPQGASPLSWDQLAQRNLQVTLSDNPGLASTHRIPQTFDCRPSKGVVPPGKGKEVLPDELMIDWGSVPAGSVASLYWPQVLASDVITLANQFYSSNPLTASDAHTIQMTVTRGVSYVPIPAGAGQNFAGLFTVDLPPGAVRAGQEFNVTVRRISSRRVVPPPPPPPPPPIQTPIQTHTIPSTFTEISGRAKGKDKAAATLPKAKVVAPVPAVAIPPQPISWRYVVGTFQVRIPVTTGDKILESEETTLAIMKWRLGQMSPSNRWYPVLERYIAYLSARVDGLGGNAQSIPPSLSGIPPALPGRGGQRELTGKVCEVLFDCFGDFEGFVLCDCEGRHHFRTRQAGIGEIVLRACKERLLLAVVVERGQQNRICKLVIRC